MQIGSFEHNLTTDLLNHLVFLQKVFMKEVNEVIQKVSGTVPQACVHFFTAVQTSPHYHINRQTLHKAISFPFAAPAAQCFFLSDQYS